MKLISGSKEPDAQAPILLPLVSVVPPAPDWLPNAHSVKEWDRLAAVLVNNGLLTTGGLSVLGVLCALHGKIVQLYAAGESPTGHMLAQYRNLTNDFGLTPVAQGRVKAHGELPGSNRFAKHGNRA